MTDRIKHGELQTAILDVVNSYRVPRTAVQIADDLGEAGVFATTSSVMVTLCRMVKDLKIKMNYKDECKHCGARKNTYYK